MQYTKLQTLEQKSFLVCLEFCLVKRVQSGSKLLNVSRMRRRSICLNTINSRFIQMSIFIVHLYTIAWGFRWISILQYSRFQESLGGAHMLLKKSLQKLLPSLLFIGRRPYMSEDIAVPWDVNTFPSITELRRLMLNLIHYNNTDKNN